MTRDKFIRVLRKELKAIGQTLEVDTRLGKGSHYRIKANGKVTTLKGGELSPGYMALIRKQLGLQ